MAQKRNSVFPLEQHEEIWDLHLHGVLSIRWPCGTTVSPFRIQSTAVQGGWHSNSLWHDQMHSNFLPGMQSWNPVPWIQSPLIKEWRKWCTYYSGAVDVSAQTSPRTQLKPKSQGQLVGSSLTPVHLSLMGRQPMHWHCPLLVLFTISYILFIMTSGHFKCGAPSCEHAFDSSGGVLRRRASCVHYQSQHSLHLSGTRKHHLPQIHGWLKHAMHGLQVGDNVCDLFNQASRTDGYWLWKY